MRKYERVKIFYDRKLHEKFMEEERINIGAEVNAALVPQPQESVVAVLFRASYSD